MLSILDLFGCNPYAFKTNLLDQQVYFNYWQEEDQLHLDQLKLGQYMKKNHYKTH